MTSGARSLGGMGAVNPPSRLAFFFIGRASRPDVAWLRLLLPFVQDVRKSRDVYMTAKKRAMNEPGEILVIAIDGSDQSSYATPYFSQSMKDTEKGWKLRWKLIDALVTNRLMHFFTIGRNCQCGEKRPLLSAPQ